MAETQDALHARRAPAQDREQRDAVALNRVILSSIVDHAVITLDMDCIVTSWNEGAERILGWTGDEAIGQSGDIFFTPEDVARGRPETEMRTALEHGRAEDERWHMRKDGSRFWASGLMMPLLPDAEDGGAGPRGFVKIFRDRTFHEQARSRIASLEQRATLAMRRAGTVGVYEFDIARQVVSADAIAAELHGVQPETANAGASPARFFRGIHPDDRARVRAELDQALARGDDFDAVYRSFNDTPRPRWIHAQAAVQFGADGRAERLSGIVVDVTEQREGAHMQEMLLRFMDEVRELTDPDRIAYLASRTIAETLYAARAGHGYMSADGDTIDIRADWTAPGIQSLVGQLRYSDFGRFAEPLRTGRTVLSEDTHTDRRVDDPSRLAAIQIRSLVNMPLMGNGRLRAVLFVNDDRPRVWTDAELQFMRSVFDRTYAAIDRLNSESERNLLAAELAHRMKNMLTMAQVIVNQSLRNATDLADARTAIAARLRALSEAQDVLTRVDNREADIRDVVQAALQPHLEKADRVRFCGPAIDLRPQQVLGLSLGLHELATNAAKYGALSDDSGRVEIGWTLEQGRFNFTWSETDGPPVSPPSSSGFGSRILNQVVAGYFGGTTHLTYDATGLRFVLDGHL